MKKNISIFPIFATLLFATPTFAQGAWAVGIQVGENLTSLTGDGASEYRLGFMAGGHASHYLLEKLVLRLEVNFEQKGAENTLPDNPFDPNVTTDIRLNYLTLPVLLRYTTTHNKIKWIFGGGMSVSYLMKELSSTEGLIAVRTNDFNRVSTDLIACTGLGYPINEKLMLGFDLRGIVGLVNVEKPRGTARQLGKNMAWGMVFGLNYYL